MTTLFACAWQQGALALSFAAGAGALEEGDDRLRPAALAQLTSASRNWSGEVAVYGRRFGLVRQQGQLYSGFYQGALPLGTSKRFQAAVGATLLHELTTLAATPSTPSQKRRLFNGALALGLHVQIFKAGPVSLHANWDAHVFSSGAATFYLSTGRKQIVSLLIGFES